MNSPPLPKQKFATIVADPPWMYTYSTRKTEVPGTGWHGAGERHYPTMTMSQLRALDVGSLALPDCALWIWVVNTQIQKGFELLSHWGFEYKTMLTWVKVAKNGTDPFFGMGYWLRGSTEHLLLGVRGRMKPLRRNAVTWFQAPVGPHSKKPKQAYRIIRSLTPGPRVDLFARRRRKGWETWGNEL